MKKITIVLTTLLLAVSAGIFTLHSCKKDQLDKINKAENQLSATDLKINRLILDFKQKVRYMKENPDFKSGETMSVDSAKWYLDAAFNFTYAFTTESFASFNTDTFSIVISKTGDLVDLDDVISAFYELKDNTLIIYNATEGEEKELYVSNMEIVSNTLDKVVIKITATIGANNNTPPPGFIQWGPFGDEDEWMYGEKLGDCSAGGGMWWGVKDAATEIKDATNTYRYKYIQDEGLGWYAYYTEPSAVITIDVKIGMGIYSDLLLNPNDSEIDNYRDYLLLYQKKDIPNGLLIETCIPWEDMNFYYHGTRKVIYEIIQENHDVFGVSANLTFCYCNEIVGKGDGNIYDPDFAYHIVTAMYKTRHISDITERTSINE
nr:hypothetical protein [Bacteroidota bacterium]